MSDQVVDLYTRVINRDIMNPWISNNEKNLNNLIIEINKTLNEGDRIPLVKFDLLPEPLA